MTEERAIEVLGIMKSQMKDFGMTARFEGLREMQETAVDVAVKSLSEIRQYRAIGTVEECREARERQRGKKVSNRTLLRDLNGNPYTVRGDCPNCGSINLVSTNTDYCNACGQKLDWSDAP